MGDKHTTTTRKANTPKVRYQNRTYEIVGRTGTIIRVNDGFAAFNIEADLTRPVNKEARELFKQMQNNG